MESFTVLPARMSLYNAARHLFPGLPKCTFYKMYNKVLKEKSKLTFAQMVEELSEKYEVCYCPQEVSNFPTILLVTNN